MCLLKPGYCQYASFVINLAVCIILLTPYSRVFLEKLTGSQIAKKFPALYGTRMLITAFTRVRYLPYPEPVQSSPCPPPLPTLLRSIVISYLLTYLLTYSMVQSPS